MHAYLQYFWTGTKSNEDFVNVHMLYMHILLTYILSNILLTHRYIHILGFCLNQRLETEKTKTNKKLAPAICIIFFKENMIYSEIVHCVVHT